MELQEIQKIIFDYVRDTFEIGDDPDYTMDVNLFDYGFVDSVGATDIILFVEERFGVEITQKDIVKYPMNSVEEIAAVIAEKLG